MLGCFFYTYLVLPCQSRRKVAEQLDPPPWLARRSRVRKVRAGNECIPILAVLKKGYMNAVDRGLDLCSRLDSNTAILGGGFQICREQI